jgi:serine/threonine protein kinase
LRSPLTDKIDVAAFGSVFYYLLTGHNPYKYKYDNHGSSSSNATTTAASTTTTATKVPFKKGQSHIVAGKLPTYPAHISNSADPSIQGLIKVIEQCKHMDPDQRPTPGEVISQLLLLSPSECFKNSPQ